MKKLNLLGVFLITLFMFSLKVQAFTITWENDFKCGEDVTLDNGTVSRTCQVGFTVSEEPYNANVAILNLTLGNFYVHSITPKKDWTITEIDKDKAYTLEYNKPGFDIQSYEIAEIVFYKINPKLSDPKDCYIEYNYDFTKVDRSCTYDVKNKTYYGLDGLPTTELQYQKDCEKNVCKMLADGTYYGKDGKTTDKETFNKDCLDLACVMEVKTCDGEDDCTIHASYGYELKDGESILKYYDKKGSEVSKEVFNYECGKHYCEKLSVPSRTCEEGSPNCYDGGKTVYYDKEGKETSIEKYTLDCFDYQCKVVYDTYFGKNGLRVSKLDYQKECETPKCEKLSDGTLFGKNGTRVDEITYRKECEKIVCEKLTDGTYYDKDGNVVDELTYNIQCLPHKCEKVGDQYFNDKGDQVNEEEYNKYCGPLPESPQTGMKISLVILSIMTIIMTTGFIIIKKKDKFVKKLS